jgi:AcrR family transcriptional regulator
VPRAIREQQMLDAAVTVFARRGYHAASMEEIADAAGITKPMIYLYIGAKDDLFMACISREAERLTAAILTEADQQWPAQEQLWRALKAFFAAVAADRDAWSLVFRRSRQEGDTFAAAALALRQQMVDISTGLLMRAAESGARVATEDDLRALGLAVVGACEALADWVVDHPEADPQVTAAQMMNLAWMGFDRLLAGERWRPADRPVSQLDPAE